MSEYICNTDDKCSMCEMYKTAEEIIRCRDCKYFRIEPWDEVLAAQYGAPPMICERTGDMDDVEPDGYCAWGERGDA